MRANANLTLSVIVFGLAASANSYAPPNRVVVTAEVSIRFDQRTGLYRYSYVFRNDPSSQQEVSSILIPLGGAAVEGVGAPQGWSVGYMQLDDAITFHATEVAEVVLPPGYQDDGNIPPSVAQIKPGRTLDGFWVASPDAPGNISFHAQGFTQLPVLGVDVLEEPDSGGPGPLDPTQSFRGSTQGPVRSAPGRPIAMTYFLHGRPARAHLPWLFLDLVVPTEPWAKLAESGDVRFANGNPWVAVGTWVGTHPRVNNVTAAGDLHAWVGLRNRDDAGTRFDFKAEVLKSGKAVASGSVHCVSEMDFLPDRADPSVAKEVAIPITFAGIVGFESSDTLTIEIATRIGTNRDGSMCPGKAAARGVRLYFDATGTPARFRLVS